MRNHYEYNFDELGLEIIDWKIYYSDRSTFSSNDGSWEEAPEQDVQVIILYQSDKNFKREHKSIILAGNDFYYKDGNRWGTSFDDPTKIFGICKYGKWTTDKNIEEIVSIAVRDKKI